jgi:glucose/arabinose dehydrogenase
VNYTRDLPTRQTVIAEFQASATNPDQADPITERDLLVVNQPFDNHKGGQLVFGTEGFLYIGLGDGGDSGDPLNNGQNLF